MRIKLKQIAGARSGDKGKHSNVGIYFLMNQFISGQKQ